MVPKLNIIHPVQSGEWKNFRLEWGNKVIETPYGIITVHKLPFSKYSIGIFEKGPEPTLKMLSDLKVVGKKNNIIFIKLEPSTAFSESGIGFSQKKSNFQKHINILNNAGCIEGKRLFTPTTFWIDLQKDEDKIFDSFTGKTRYNIRLAQKHGVGVVEDNSSSAFENYLRLTFETAKRQGFYAHTQKYHRLMWKYLHIRLITKGKKPIAHLLTAVYKKEIITAWVLFTYKEFLYYPYGASSEKYKNVMANNLMMWEAIKFGKKMGCRIFDLWGREEGKGFTKFKEGYNPEIIEFLGSWDLVINPLLYKIYRFAENLRWFILRIIKKGINFGRF